MSTPFIGPSIPSTTPALSRAPSVPSLLTATRRGRAPTLVQRRRYRARIWDMSAARSGPSSSAVSAGAEPAGVGFVVGNWEMSSRSVLMCRRVLMSALLDGQKLGYVWMIKADAALSRTQIDCLPCHNPAMPRGHGHSPRMACLSVLPDLGGAFRRQDESTHFESFLPAPSPTFRSTTPAKPS